MSQWKGYSPDNVLTAASAAEAGPHAAVNAGALTYEPYYGLKTKPFSLSTDPRALYPCPGHAQVLDDLLSGIRRREGLVVLTGEMGTGKTTLCRAALYQLDRKTFTTFVPDPSLSREDLLRMLLVDFGEVSVDDLRRGRLAGASRPDLSYQLYEFLTSLESVDAFAVLVIDEAQHLASPLLDEIRALSELEAGRRLLQIVLVGQPELQTHLKNFQMRQIDQRVTTRCELHPLTRDDVAGYVAHRLAIAGADEARISFAPEAIDLIHDASNGVPRIVNTICDRALARAHHAQTSVVGPPIVGQAIDDLQVGLQPVTSPIAKPTRREREAVPVPPPEKRSTARGLFEKRPATQSAAPASELHALLDLPVTDRRRDAETAADRVALGAAAAPAWKWRVDSEARRGARWTWLKNLGLSALAMAVVLIAGGIAVTAQRGRGAAQTSAVAPAPAQSSVSNPAPPPTTAQVSTSITAAVIAPSSSDLTDEGSAAALAPHVPVAAQEPTLSDTWVVQVAAFSNSERSLALVERLKQSGFPAYQLRTDAASAGVLHMVRVGPFKTAAEADDARAKLQHLSDLEGAFVRNVTKQ